MKRNDTREQIIALLTEVGPLTVREITERLHLGQTTTAYYHLGALLEAGRIRNCGAGRIEVAL